MGFFSSIGRAVGRVAGRVVEGVGKLVHSETIQRVGRDIHAALPASRGSCCRQSSLNITRPTLLVYCFTVS